MPPLPKPTDPTDYDGTDYTPLMIQVSAARGTKELLGEGSPGEPVATSSAPPKPPPQTAPAPAPVPAANGHGKANGTRPRR
jgi:hypothetical protein